MYDHVFPPCFQEIPALPSSDPFPALFILTLSFYLVSLLIGFLLLCFLFFLVPRLDLNARCVHPHHLQLGRSLSILPVLTARSHFPFFSSLLSLAPWYL